MIPAVASARATATGTFPRRSVALSSFFFFQAEDGIRDGRVTGVQTCALPICRAGVGGRRGAALPATADGAARRRSPGGSPAAGPGTAPRAATARAAQRAVRRRSEERRVGKEGRSRRSPEQ